MQIMLQDLIDKQVEYALTVDFDSIFTADHVQRLVSIIAQEESIDALAAIQPKRSSGTILASTGTAEHLDWSGYPLRVKTAHFGLTVIDLSKLATVPKPWFLAVPDAKGEWGDGRIDADVFFWKAWEKAGHSVFVEPGTRLGHLEEMVTFFDSQMQLHHEYLNDWKSRDDTVDKCKSS